MRTYKEWLLSQLWDENFVEWESFIDKWSVLTDILLNVEYVAVVKGDQNRAEDGLYLRSEFNHEEDANLNMDIPASVLEVLVALACRMEREYVGDSEENLAYEIFEMFMGSLGLTWVASKTLSGGLSKKELKIVAQTLDSWLQNDGSVSIFPVTEYELPELEGKQLWQQMLFFIENSENSWKLTDF